MWSKRLFIAALAIAVGLWDACIVSWLPSPWIGLRVAPILVAALAVFSSPERWVLTAVISGAVADLFLPSNAGFVPLRFLLVGSILFYLSQRLFTNRSLMSVTLLFVCWAIIDRAMLWVLEGVQIFAGRSVTAEVQAPILFSVIWFSAVGAGVFFGFVLFSKRFLPLITIGRASRRMGRVRL